MVLPDGRWDDLGATRLDTALKSPIKDEDFSVIIDMDRVPCLSSHDATALMVNETARF